MEINHRVFLTLLPEGVFQNTVAAPKFLVDSPAWNGGEVNPKFRTHNLSGLTTADMKAILKGVGYTGVGKYTRSQLMDKIYYQTAENTASEARLKLREDFRVECERVLRLHQNFLDALLDTNVGLVQVASHSVSRAVFTGPYRLMKDFGGIVCQSQRTGEKIHPDLNTFFVYEAKDVPELTRFGV